MLFKLKIYLHMTIINGKKTFKLKLNGFILKAGKYWKLSHKYYIYAWIFKEKENLKKINSLVCTKIHK